MSTVKNQKRRLITRAQRGLRYPVEFVAAELGVDRKTMERRCEASGFHLNGAGLTFREAYEALSSRSEDAAAIRRKRLADAASSETDALNKQRKFVFRDDHKNIVKDLAVQTRVRIESASYITQESRRRLAKEIAEIKPGIAEPSHK